MLRWGLLSTARINRRLHAAIEASDRSVIVAVASRDELKARSYAAEWDVPRAYGSYAALLEDADVDVIYNPLPNHLHAPWSVRALRAGKHVLCEKPMAISPVQVDVMVRAARAADRVLAEGLMYRHHPRTKRVRQLIGDGRIGPLRFINGAFSFSFDRDDNFRMDPSQGGGAMWDVGCYPVSFARYVVGEEPQSVEALSVDGPSDIDLGVAGVMRFPGGVLATFQAGFDAVFRSEMTFVGTLGEIHVPLAFRPGAEAIIRIRNEAGESEETVPGFDPIFVGEVRDLEAAILDGATQEVSWAESRGNAAALHALLDSARTGHTEHPAR